MKKFIILCLVCMVSMLFCVSYAELPQRYTDNDTMLNNLDIQLSSDDGDSISSSEKLKEIQKEIQSNQEYRFFSRLQTCSVIKNENGSAIYGKTKDGRCHFVLKEEQKKYHCIVPMQATLGFASTWLDTLDYTLFNHNEELRSKRSKQFIEIGDMVRDYCKIK